MSLWLVGMRGAGKSAAGRLAAARLGVPFVDLDRAIERHVGLDVASIFAARGEVGFRQLELEQLRALSPAGDALVALGAGAITRAEVRDELRRRGRAVWLTARSEVLWARIRGSNRPPLTPLSPERELGVLAAEREPLYRDCSAARIDTSGLTLEQVAHVIEQLWTTLPHHDLR